MNHNSTRDIALLRWHYLPWALVLVTIPVAWFACTSHPLTQPIPQPAQETDLYISVSPVRQLDLVFMIDNSPSMAPKQAKLKAQFPKLLAALRDPTSGALPDLRVAIIDSDLGTGGAYTDGTCGPKTLPDGTASNYGDLGRFQMIGARDCGVTDSSAMWLEYANGQPVNYTGDVNDVFACLASNLGTLGCGEEHQLQAFEFANLGFQAGIEAGVLQGDADVTGQRFKQFHVFAGEEVAADSTAQTDDGNSARSGSVLHSTGKVIIQIQQGCGALLVCGQVQGLLSIFKKDVGVVGGLIEVQKSKRQTILRGQCLRRQAVGGGQAQ